MRLAVALALVALVGGNAGAGEQDAAVRAVLTGGKGVLTKCFSWFSSPTCNTYHHIAVPQRITIGDTVRLTYGSNPKSYGFAAVSIALQGDRCTIFSEQPGSSDRVDKLVVMPCKSAPPR